MAEGGQKPIKVVTMGGGTGQRALLRALRLIPNVEITTVVTMADSGKSSGRLRLQYGVPPPGDVLQCVIALSDYNGDPAEHPLRKRFLDGPLMGDNIGNWFLTVGAADTGDFTYAVRLLCFALGVKGTVLPVTVGQIELWGRSLKGKWIRGEHEFDALDGSLDPDDRVINVWLKPNASVLGEVRGAIQEAQFIILAPGDLFSSIIPIPLVRGVTQAMAVSSAHIIYVCNMVTTRGQTDHFTLTDFVKVLEMYLGEKEVNTVLFHSGGIDDQRRKVYAEKDKAFPVLDDDARLLKGCNVVRGDFLAGGEYIRHDPEKLAEALKTIFSVPKI